MEYDKNELGIQNDDRGLTLIAYDISENKRRRKLEKCLRGYGLRVQESVFETLLGKQKKVKMLKDIKEIIDPKEDNVRIYQSICEKRIIKIGDRNEVAKQDIVVI